MRILIDIGHPAHVHYFRNFIRLMQNKGHEFFITARNRSIIFHLLKHYEIDYFDRGRGSNSIAGKLVYMLHADIKILKCALRFRPDIFVSFASPYAAQVSWLLRKPHVALDDTEHATFSRLFYKPFSKVFLNPSCFYENFGIRQIHYNSFAELFYLHSNYFTPSDEVLELLGIKDSIKYILLRFVSWSASHDIGHSGLDMETKRKLVKILSKEYRVFISTEEENPDVFFEPYLLKIPPEKIHDVIFFAHLFVAESGTMASEAAVLGTPVIYVNSLPLMGYLKEEMNAGILFHFKDSLGVVEKVTELLLIQNLKNEFFSNRQKILADKIDITSFMIWFIENYPESVEMMNRNPDFQYNFK